MTSSSPTLLDPRAPRLAAAGTAVVLASALLLPPTAALVLVLAQTVVFALGAVGRAPYGPLFRRVVRPRLGPPSELEDARPVRFAQQVGLAFAVTALVGFALNLPLLVTAALAAALAAAFLNAAFGICLGCEVYLLLHRARAARPSSAPHDRTHSEVSA